MTKRMISLSSILLIIILAATLLTSCGSSSSPATSNSGVSTAAGQALMQDRCSVCHSLNRVTSAHNTAAEWKVIVDQMINRGAQLSAQEEQTLITYLAQTYK